MKNKGFTIVELLATIVLIGIISLVALGSYSGIKKTIMKSQTNNVISNIESTAIVYSTSRDRTGWISLAELIENDFIDKTDLLRIDKYEDPEHQKCDLLIGTQTDPIVNPAVGIFIDQKYAKTNVETEETNGVSASANLVKNATFFCTERNVGVDQAKIATPTGTATNSRYRNYSLSLEAESGYQKIHLSCTNGFFASGDDLGVRTSIVVNDLTPSDTCTLLLYHADPDKGSYIKYTYIMG